MIASLSYIRSRNFKFHRNNVCILKKSYKYSTILLIVTFASVSFSIFISKRGIWNGVMDDSAILLNWPGGKRSLLKQILPLVPENYCRYYEPFMGGGALFFTLKPALAVIADKNAELMNCYQQIRDCPDAVISRLSRMKNTKEDYYKVRDNLPKENIARAARIIYLMALSFNGVYRVNLQGKFNVPYGDNKSLTIYDTNKIYAASAALASTDIRTGDFKEALTDAGSGDFVYLDPPYTVMHNNNGFIKYNDHIFSWEDQERLAVFVKELVKRGCKVVISNADHPSIENLYVGFYKQKVTRSSTISASTKFRCEITECLFYC